MSPTSNSAYSPNDDAQRLWPRDNSLSAESSKAKRLRLFAKFSARAFIAAFILALSTILVSLNFSPSGWLWVAGLVIVLPLVLFALVHVWHAFFVRSQRKSRPKKKRRTFM